MIALAVVLEHELPVGTDFVSDLVRQLDSVSLDAGELLLVDQGRHGVVERGRLRGVLVEIDVDRPEVGCAPRLV